MPSNLKSETARRNGARSRGPITEAGKRTASRNALRHGIHSTQVVLEHEDAHLYDQLLAAYLEEWQPATATEEAMVLDMVNARWRLQRIQQLASATIERDTQKYIDWARSTHASKHKALTDEAICVEAHEWSADKKTLENFERWEGRLHRLYQRSLKTLRSLQAERLAAPRSTSRLSPEPVGEERAQHETASSPGSVTPTQQDREHCGGGDAGQREGGSSPLLERPEAKPVPDLPRLNGHGKPERISQK